MTERELQAQFKEYELLVNEINTNETKLKTLLERGFMNLILSDPDDIKLEKQYVKTQTELNNALKAMTEKYKASQEQYLKTFTSRSMRIPKDRLKYLWALPDEMKQ